MNHSKRTKRSAPLLHLPPELLCSIYCEARNLELAWTCTAIHRILSQDWVKKEFIHHHLNCWLISPVGTMVREGLACLTKSQISSVRRQWTSFRLCEKGVYGSPEAVASLARASFLPDSERIDKLIIILLFTLVPVSQPRLMTDTLNEFAWCIKPPTQILLGQQLIPRSYRSDTALQDAQRMQVYLEDVLELYSMYRDDSQKESLTDLSTLAAIFENTIRVLKEEPARNNHSQIQWLQDFLADRLLKWEHLRVNRAPGSPTQRLQVCMESYAFNRGCKDVLYQFIRSPWPISHERLALDLYEQGELKVVKYLVGVFGETSIGFLWALDRIERERQSQGFPIVGYHEFIDVHLTEFSDVYRRRAQLNLSNRRWFDEGGEGSYEAWSKQRHYR